MLVKRGKGDYAKVYRPCRISEVYGQEEIKKIIANGLNDKSLGKTLLFYGTSGTGKTTIGRIIGMGLNCQKGPTSEPCCDCEGCMSVHRGGSFGFCEFNAGYFSGVEKMRETKRNFAAAPLGPNRYKICLFDECHRLSKEAQTLLLKEVEDGFGHVWFILCSTEIKSIIPTLINRCMKLEFKELPPDDIRKLLLDVCQCEGIKPDPVILDTIIEEAKGMPRNALFELQKAVAAKKLEKITEPIEITMELVKTAFEGNSPENTIDINP